MRHEWAVLRIGDCRVTVSERVAMPSQKSKSMAKSAPGIITSGKAETHVFFLPGARGRSARAAESSRKTSGDVAGDGRANAVSANQKR
jgi:hypothetical protein